MELRKNSYLKIWLVGLIFVFWFSSGELSLAVDGYEPDDTYGQANTITTDGVVQTHDFDPVGDNDWVKFSAVDGDNYKIATSNLGLNCDTYIKLYDTDGTTLLKEDYNSGVEPFTSRIIWAASGPGTYYVMARHFDDSVGGSGTNYDISINTFTPGSISVTVVSDADGSPIPDLQVYVEDHNEGFYVDSAYTQADGSYTISGLYPGSYRVSVSTWGTDYVAEYYDDVVNTISDSITPVVVTEGEDTSNINFGLAIGGVISGVVTANSDGSPISGLWVYVEDYNNEYYMGATCTQADGSYIVKGLYTGSYRVSVSTWGTDYVAEYYDDVIEYDNATPVNVTEGTEASNINFALSLVGSISGTVTTTGGTPLSDIYIEVFDSDWNWIDEGVTVANGNYSFSGLVPRSYYVEAWDYTGVYAGEYYDNVTGRSQATLVSVNEGVDTSNVNFALALAGLISGVVVADDDGIPIPEMVLLVAFDYDSNEIINSGFTDVDGSYVINGLHEGDYRVWAFTGFISETEYASEYYNNILDYQDATPVNVITGEDTSDINFGLAAGGSISGITFYSGTKTGIINIGVFLVSSYIPFRPTSIGFFGPPLSSYLLDGVASGEWYVAAFMDVNRNNNYDSGEPFGEYALNPVSVTAGFNTPNINIVLNGMTGINNPPVLDSIGNKTVKEGELLAFVITAT
ncbi:MAG: carboxypeptidase regulatory-like domain-containing protein, partial [Deltaproteobacteria bacterium]